MAVTSVSFPLLPSPGISAASQLHHGRDHSRNTVPRGYILRVLCILAIIPDPRAAYICPVTSCLDKLAALSTSAELRNRNTAAGGHPAAVPAAHCAPAARQTPPAVPAHIITFGIGSRCGPHTVAYDQTVSTPDPSWKHVMPWSCQDRALVSEGDRAAVAHLIGEHSAGAHQHRVGENEPLHCLAARRRRQ